MPITRSGQPSADAHTPHVDVDSADERFDASDIFTSPHKHLKPYGRDGPGLWTDCCRSITEHPGGQPLFMAEVTVSTEPGTERSAVARFRNFSGSTAHQPKLSLDNPATFCKPEPIEGCERLHRLDLPPDQLQAIPPKAIVDAVSAQAARPCAEVIDVATITPDRRRCTSINWRTGHPRPSSVRRGG